MNLPVSDGHPCTLDGLVMDPFANIDQSDLPIACQQFDNIRKSCKYYSLPQACQTNPNLTHIDCSKELQILHVNSRSIQSDCKFEEFEQFLHQSKVEWSIICISETWLSTQTEIKRHLDGYNGFFDSRKSGTGGGVAIYVSDKAELANQLNTPVLDGVESLFIECKFPRSETFIAGEIYRPPNIGNQTFLEQFEICLQHITNKKQAVFIAGDFNYDLLSMSEDSCINEFFNIFGMYGFLPTISKTTRLSLDKKSLLDNIFTNNIGLISVSGIIFNDNSDHFPIFVTCNLSTACEKREKQKISRFDYHQIESLSQYLYNTLEEVHFTEIQNPEVACNALLDTYKEGIKKYSITFTPTRKTTPIKPWISPAILCSINNRHKLYSVMSKTPTEINIREYRRYKNILNNVIRDAKKHYYQRQLEMKKGKPKELWKTLNTLTKGKKQADKFPAVFQDAGGNSISDRTEIANAFNDCFTTIGEKLQESIPQSGIDPLSYINHTNQETLSYLEPTNNEEISIVIKQMNNVGAGVDGINAKIFKGTYFAILRHIVHFMNLCLGRGVFPEKLKIAVIKPVYKAGKKNICGNYRPISMLPYISKILEKLIHERIIKYLIANDTISECQFGFQTGLSTYMPHILLQDLITHAFEKSHFVCGIYLDLKKAFDTVELLQKHAL